MSTKKLRSHRKPPEYYMKVFTMYAEGHSQRAIAEAVGGYQPNIGKMLRDPELRNQYLEPAKKAAEHNLYVLANRMDTLMLRRSEEALDGTKPYSDQQLAVNWGIAHDKIARLRQDEKPVNHNTFVIKLDVPPPVAQLESGDTVEGEIISESS